MDRRWITSTTATVHSTGTDTTQHANIHTHGHTRRCNQQSTAAVCAGTIEVRSEAMKFRDVGSVTCRQCGKADETVKHVIETCDAPAVIDIRSRMNRKIRKLCDKYQENITDIGNILNPTAKNVRAMKKAHKITGRMISLLQPIWDY